jgi:hypothetical protein
MPTDEDTTAIKGRHAPPTADGRADEPGTPTAEVALRAHDARGIVLILPASVAAAMRGASWLGQCPHNFGLPAQRHMAIADKRCGFALVPEVLAPGLPLFRREAKPLAKSDKRLLKE